jgi:acyl-coenzyme A synthetase/AMP-(fatty) acid ligase
MSTLTLESVLRQLPPARPCLIGTAGCVTVGQTLEVAHALRANWSQVNGGRIALCGLPPGELIPALIALDGFAKELLLLPASTDAGTSENLMAQAGVTHILEAGTKHCRAVNDGCFEQTKGEPTRWLLATSGTTGAPKLIAHRLATLTRTVHRDPVRGADFVWGLLYDPARFAGLQVVLQALFSGSALVLSERVEFDSQVTALMRYPVNALSATPTLWRKLLMDGRISNLVLRQLTLGGETADQAILDALKARFPAARIVHIYASTEAGTGFAVQDGRAGFPSDWLNDTTRNPALRVSAHGHLLIKASLMPQGAEINARLNSEGYLDTQDLVRLEGDRVLFMGRASGAINVGGNKVNPEWLESYLRGIEGVLDARVFAKSSSMMGQLVAAEIMATEGAELKSLRQHILQCCRSELESWQTPALITFVNALKETAAGKRERLST